MAVHLAYDGSTGGDWLAHYAVRLAAQHPARCLHLVHVADGQRSAGEVSRAAERIVRQCESLSVACHLHELRPGRDVASTLLVGIPQDGETYLVCGTRLRGGRRGYLSGTASHRLLCAARCHVLALRVVQPGLLGLPRQLLLPVAGHPRGFRSGLPFLRLFGPDTTHLHLLYVERVGRWRLRRLAHEAVEARRHAGEGYCQRIERELDTQLGLGHAVVDAQVVVSDDVSREIVVAANRTHARLIYMGASERSLAQRMISAGPIEQVLRTASCDVAVYRGQV